jgi:WD40 repeat protein
MLACALLFNRSKFISHELAKDIITLSKDTTLVSSEWDGVIKFWDIIDCLGKKIPTPLLTLRDPESKMLHFAWEPNGDRLAIGSGAGTIKILDVDRFLKGDAK